MNQIKVDGHDEARIVKVTISPWFFHFVRTPQGKVLLTGWGRRDKSRAYQREDIEPPKSWQRKAREKAVKAFAKRDISGELRLF